MLEGKTENTAALGVSDMELFIRERRLKKRMKERSEERKEMSLGTE